MFHAFLMHRFNPNNWDRYFPGYLEDAINSGDINHFKIHVINGNQHRVTQTIICNKYNILEYAALRNQVAIFFYLVGETDGWQKHIKLLLAANIKKIIDAAIQGQSQEILEYLANIVRDQKQELTSMQFGDDKKTILHLIAANFKKHKQEFVVALINQLKIKSKEKNFWRDIHGNTPLHDAVMAGNLDAVVYFIEKLHFSPLERNFAGHTAFNLITNSDGTKNTAVTDYAQQWMKRYREILWLSHSITENEKNLSRSALCSEIKYAIVEYVPYPKIDTAQAEEIVNKSVFITL